MAVKTRLNNDDYSALPEPLKALYKEGGNGWVMDLDADDDFDVVRRTKDLAKQEARDAKARAKELEAQLAELSDGAARKSGDIAALDKSYGEKLAQKDAIVASKDKIIRDLLVDSKARSLASKISTSPDLILPHLQKRFDVEFDGETAKTRIRDGSGQLSALTEDDLEKEFRANPAFAPILIGAKASGSGAAATSGGGVQGKKIAQLNLQEKQALLQEVGQERFLEMVQSQRS